MQSDRSAAVAATSGSVRGLGVCDVLHARLAAVQWEGLVAALDARIAALAAGEPETAAERGEERRLLRRMRAQLPASSSAPLSLVGPAGLVLGIVQACLTDAVDALADGLGDGFPAAWPARLAGEAEAAAAWIATALDCRAVDGYCFDPGADPAHAW